jgi:predicted esterase
MISSKRIFTADNIEVSYDYFEILNNDKGILFLHGFGGDKKSLKHFANEVSLRLKICSSCLPNMTSLMENGTFRELYIEQCVRGAQIKNVKLVVDYLTNSLCSNWNKFIIVGHSAGCGIALEAAVELQKLNKSPIGLLLFDAVPWEPTIEIAREFNLSKTVLCHIKSEPSAWNKNNLFMKCCNEMIMNNYVIDAHSEDIVEKLPCVRSLMPIF